MAPSGVLTSGRWSTAPRAIALLLPWLLLFLLVGLAVSGHAAIAVGGVAAVVVIVVPPVAAAANLSAGLVGVEISTIAAHATAAALVVGCLLRANLRLLRVPALLALSFCALFWMGARATVGDEPALLRYPVAMALTAFGWYLLTSWRQGAAVKVLGAFGWLYLAANLLAAAVGFSLAADSSVRFDGIAGNPNNLATGVAVLMPWSCVIFTQTRARIWALFCYCIGGGYLVAQTLSNTALATFPLAIVMTVALVAFSGRRRDHARTFRLPHLLAGAAAAAVACAFLVPALLERFREQISEGELSGRELIWEIGWDTVFANPLVGIGNVELSSSWFEQRTMHNTLLEVSLLGGVIAAALLVATACWALVSSFRHGEFATGISLAILAVTSFTHSTLFMPLFWAMIGYISAVLVSQRRGSPASTSRPLRGKQAVAQMP